LSFHFIHGGVIRRLHWHYCVLRKRAG
jgi:hypothetical protein